MDTGPEKRSGGHPCARGRRRPAAALDAAAGTTPAARARAAVGEGTLDHLGSPGWSGCSWAVQALLTFTADAGSFFALGGQDVGVAGIGVAPSQISLGRAGEHGAVGAVGVALRERAQWQKKTTGRRVGARRLQWEPTPVRSSRADADGSPIDHVAHTDLV
ncbi:hypothetical protein C8D88_108201 [Lentzea atacamensis]|uniref:Uncharacterized protein n=1 Tax=Lentzea atacamensis TaxID=531938 RepID=A0A316HVF0_9PSEU|nr:hypothetical protein C8D88_108201 [Lentzea atacamensis]